MPTLTHLHFDIRKRIDYRLLAETPPITCLKEVKNLRVLSEENAVDGSTVSIADILRPFLHVVTLDIEIGKNIMGMDRIGTLIPNIENLFLSGIIISPDALYSLSRYCFNLRNLKICIQEDSVLRYLPTTIECLTMGKDIAYNKYHSDDQAIPTRDEERYVDITKICPNLSSLVLYGREFHLNFHSMVKSSSLLSIQNDTFYGYRTYPLAKEDIYENFRELWDKSCETRPVELKNSLMEILEMMPEVLIDLIIDIYIPKRIKIE
jgi:hypothetical protein